MSGTSGISGTTGPGLDFPEQFAVAAEHFAIDVARCDLGAPVSTCPGWSTYDLVVHLGNIHAWAATIVETGQKAVEQNDQPPSHAPDAVSLWYAAKAEDLYTVLRSADPGRACWNFTGTGLTARFWPRRQVHETTMHQVDLDQAMGRTTVLSRELSADGVAEVLSVFLPRMHSRGAPATLLAPLTLRATDTGDAWTLTPAPATALAPPTVVRRTLPGADRIEAPADVLFRLLWKRTEPRDPALKLEGDRDRIDAFLASRLTP